LNGKIFLDTNVFIDYFRVGIHADWAAGKVEGTVRFLSSVVLMELRLGADTPRRRRAIDRLQAAFPERRVIAPAASLYDRAGTLFRRIHKDGKGLTDRLGAVNDILIALSAWRIGALVVTSNVDDFARIGKHLAGFRWTAP
jgi:predicted nucleic acid-binding protein